MIDARAQYHPQWIGDRSQLSVSVHRQCVKCNRNLSGNAVEYRIRLVKRIGADQVVFPERQLGYWTAARYSSDYISNYIALTDGYSNQL